MLSIEEVYKEYSDMIYRWILARTGDEFVAEEITQETFYQAVLHAESYDYSCKVSTWLCSIASNKLKEYLRKNPALDQLPWERTPESGAGSPGDSGHGSAGAEDGIRQVPGGAGAAAGGAGLAASSAGSAVSSSAEDQAVQAEENVELYRAIHSLPEPSREVVHLRAFAGLSFRQIGDIFGKSENWARVTYFRAKAALRKELGKNE